jgi:hypothetical protein
VTTDSGTVLAPSCVIYDQRFQQLSTNLFNVVTSCALAGTTPAACCTNDQTTQALAPRPRT